MEIRCYVPFKWEEQPVEQAGGVLTCGKWAEERSEGVPQELHLLLLALKIAGGITSNENAGNSRSVVPNLLNAVTL